MRLADSAGTNEKYIVIARQKGPLRQFELPDLGNAWDQRKVKVLQPFLVGQERGFEPLAQLLLVPMSQFPFEEGLQIAHAPQSSLLSFAGQGLTIGCHPREP